MIYRLPMNYKPLVSMIDRLGGELDEQESVLLAVALLTWQHLVQCQRVTADSTLTPELATSPRSASQVLLGLAQELGLEPFEGAAKMLDNISQRTATEVLQATLRTQEQGNLENFDPSDIAMVTGGAKHDGIRFLPAKVSDLMTALALDGADDQASIYLPWDASGQLLGRCLKSGRTASMETPRQGYSDFEVWMRDLIRAYFEWPMQSQLVSGDPIRSPAFQDKGALRKFDLVMATPPFGGRSDPKGTISTFSFGMATSPFGGRSDQWDPTLDVFERFPDKTSSLTVLAIRHVMAQTAGRAVIAVTNSVLFSSGGERRLRKDLLDEGVVQAVIGLPNGLLADSNIPFALLVLDKHQCHETVRFVNCDSAHFKEAESRTRFTLKSIHDIIELALGRASGADSADVRRDDLQQTEWNLLPSRHVIDAGMSLVDKVMGQYATVSLEEIAEVLRPLAETVINDPIEVLEVGAADIQGSGFIATPTKAIEVSKSRTKGGAVFLQPGDIVFVIKGSVGKVSIAPEDTPPVGPGGWVVGQSMAVVRINKPHAYRMAMAVFFRSDIGQELLRRLAAGATIPFLQIRELRQLRVPSLNAEEVEQAARVLTAQEVLRRQILELQVALGRLKFEPWSSTDAAATTGSNQ